MSYVVPSVLVYQDLLNSGGVLNSTPDLEACIIGPAYNKVTYASTTAGQVLTAAQSTTSTTGYIVSGEYTLTVISTGGFAVDDTVLVLGAGSSGATLRAKITGITGNVITLDTAAGTTLTSLSPGLVTRSGVITNPLVDNTFTLPSQKVGQLVDSASIVPWLDDVKVETFNGLMAGHFTGNSLYAPSTVTTAITNAAATTATITSNLGFAIGDTISIPGAGVAGATYTGVVSATTATSLTFPATSTQVPVGTIITKLGSTLYPANLNATTNTLRIEPGDEVRLSYTDTSAVARTFTSTAVSIVTSSSQNGYISRVNLADMLPSNMCYQTTVPLAITAGAVSFVVASATGIVVGAKVLVRGAGANGGDHIAEVTVVASTTITISAPTLTTTGTSSVVIVLNKSITTSFRKSYQDQQLAAVKPIAGVGANFDVTNASTLGQVTLKTGLELIYGKVMSANVYFSYKALRNDVSNQVLTINDTLDLQGQLGDVSSENPLALGCQIALANTTGRVRAIAISSNDLIGYQNALEFAEGERLYFLVPLTQETAILALFATHVKQMSTPINAAWRVAVVNTAMSTTRSIGNYSASFVDSTTGNSTSVLTGNTVVYAANGNFITNGVIPGDTITTSATTGGVAGTYSIYSVVSNQQVVIQGTTPGISTQLSYYISRKVSKTEMAATVKSTSENFGSNRVWHIQPDICGISIGGVTEYLPGYYLCCGIAGMGAGFPVQQGFTNIGVAGITDLKDSNFFFSKAQLNTMAEGGTCIFAQQSQGSIPYVRHAMTTDVSVLEYREQLVTKNWDFLSYFYYDKLKGFIGSWNITPDTIRIIGQTITASSELVKSQKLPKIGAPLMGYKILSLEQNKYNKDNLDCNLSISVVYPLNYLNLHLII